MIFAVTRVKTAFFADCARIQLLVIYHHFNYLEEIKKI